jgi:hypothetical protein
MKFFPSKSAKSHHIKKNSCKPRSIIHARVPNFQNISKLQNAHYQTNIENQTNIQNQNITNNIFINNFGSERIDHIEYEDIKTILESGVNTLPLYIQRKHFDTNFPENNNIIYSIANICKVKENGRWVEKDISVLSSKLLRENTEVLLLFCDKNELKLMSDIQDEDKYKFIKNKLFIIYEKSDNHKQNDALSKIKDLIKNSKPVP